MKTLVRCTRRVNRLAALLGVALVLVACSSNVTTRVMTFRGEGLDVSGATAFIRPASAEMSGTQQFKYYANALVPRLENLGLKVVDKKTGADYVVELGFGVARREAEDRGSSSVIFSTGYYHRGGFGVVVSGDDDTDFEFERIVNIALLDASKLQNQQRVSLLEVSAVSVGRCDLMQQVYEKMLDAVFTDFYRANGSTVRVKVPIKSDYCRTR